MSFFNQQREVRWACATALLVAFALAFAVIRRSTADVVWSELPAEQTDEYPPAMWPTRSSEPWQPRIAQVPESRQTSDSAPADRPLFDHPVVADADITPQFTTPHADLFSAPPGDLESSRLASSVGRAASVSA